MDTAYKTLDETDFRIYSREEILQLSVKEIISPQTFDLLQNAILGGLHDPALGPCRQDDRCDSCGQSEKNCPGHFGHIALPVLVFNPLIFKSLLKLLKGTCLACHRFNIPNLVLRTYYYHIKLLRRGFIREAQSILDWLPLVKMVQVEDLENHMRQLEKEISFADSVASPYVKILTQKAINNVMKLFHISPPTCIHCNEKNRSLKAENNQTIIGTSTVDRRKDILDTTTTTASKNNDHKTQRQDKSADDEEEVVDDEVEMDVESTSNVKIEVEETIKPELLTVQMQTEIEHFLKSPQKRSILSPFLAKEHLKQLWKTESDVLKCFFPFLETVECTTSIPTDVFFLDVIPVPPSRYRPLSVVKERKFEHSQTSNLSSILSEAQLLKETLALYSTKMQEEKSDKVEGLNMPLPEISVQTLMERILGSWLRLQSHVNVVLDTNLDRFKTTECKGIKQILEKKEGLLRMHMMGKRVNFAARSVISPDPYIATNEIGIPMVFASKLTYPQRVTPWNADVLRQMVINGPANYPGASSVISDDGTVVRLNASNESQRTGIANQLLVPSKDSLDGKTVCRHLINGDFLLLNRQPTLHRPSIQAHKARVLPSIKTLRLHYSSCKAYNADFDGDEMNAHFPQCELGRAEASTLAKTDFQYLVPKDGSPLGGLIQDHMVSGVSLTVRGCFFNRRDYCGLIWSAMNDWKDKLVLVPPAIMKPGPLWSGKQIVSTILLNIIPKEKAPLNLNGKAKIPEKSWIDPNFFNHPSMTPFNLEAWKSNEMGESTVVVRKGELLQGVLDKAHYGPSAFGLVHCCYELYGGIVAGQLLTYLGRLFTNYLQMIGFSLGVGDILVLRKADKKRRRFVRDSHHVGKRAVMKALGVRSEEDALESELLSDLKKAHLGDQLKMAEVDMFMKRETDQIQDSIAKSIMPRGLEKEFPRNALQLMVQSGAKGSPVNCMQISCLLGQIELEGRRPPLMISGKSLPSFLPYDVSPQAGGFVSGRFLTGINPQEYFFHCMAGREGLIDTAVKTSRSGYLQRCLVKHLEDVMVNYDFTVRDSSGIVLQFYYGEDGLEPTQSPFLKTSQFPFLTENFKNMVNTETPWTSAHQEKEVKRMWKKISKSKARSTEAGSWMDRKSGFLEFCESESAMATGGSQRKLAKGKYVGRTKATKKLCEAWFKLDDESRRRYSQRSHCPDPVMSQFLPHSHADILPEKLRHNINVYCKKGLPKIAHQISEKESPDADAFREALNKKVVQSMAHPGDPVGLICAQSIGEPSTQMTLNTFHFAGRGEMNVTLGIPRLREILMTGGMTMKTPSMDVPIRNVPDARAKAEKLKRHLNKTTLDQVMESVKVKITSSFSPSGNFKTIDAKFKFLHRSQYADITNLEPTALMNFIATRFLVQMDKEILKCRDVLEKAGFVSSGRVRRSNTTTGESEEPDQADKDEDDVIDLDINDIDAATLKESQRLLDTQGYEGEDEERDAVVDVVDSDSDQGVDDQDEAVPVPDEEGGDESRSQSPETGNEVENGTKPEKIHTMESKIRQKALSHRFVKDFTFDERKKRWFQVKMEYPPSHLQFDVKLMLTKLVKKTVVHEVKRINRAILVEEEDGGETVLHLKTEGVNIEALSLYPQILDLNRIYSNDINVMAVKYGIEATNRVITKEIQNVFGAYGITVDYHHLSLLADYLTNQGVYNAFNRKSIHFKASPLQKMTFETTMTFLLDAIESGDKDSLNSPSSSLIVGKPVKIGTGCFDVLACA